MDVDLLAELDPARSLDKVQKKIHLRYVKTGPRAITIVEGLDFDLDLVRIAQAMKKKFNCAASIQTDKFGNEVIQLQGNHVANVRGWLVQEEVLTKKEAEERVVTHGV
jgi:translation initiation factor SUI1